VLPLPPFATWTTFTDIPDEDLTGEAADETADELMPSLLFCGEHNIPERSGTTGLNLVVPFTFGFGSGVLNLIFCVILLLLLFALVETVGFNVDDMPLLTTFTTGAGTTPIEVSPFADDTKVFSVEKGFPTDERLPQISVNGIVGCIFVGLFCTMIGRGENLDGEEAPHVLIGGKLGMDLTGVVLEIVAGFGRDGDCGVFFSGVGGDASRFCCCCCTGC
jgi:hypothetical protein